ncbi:hypothetical protein [Neobacillus mesonae]|uniref:hypothetical protein n=1 Tax=Neobacillus mesonae TaxID=1193713 RepID=UPI00257488F6|nr:hypothetical protein [Neobacillus mesonae]
MTREKIYPILVNIYTDFFDGLYTKEQLKFMLRKIHLAYPEINSNDFAELCLDAQWENATEKDYEETKKINEERSGEENTPF